MNKLHQIIALALIIGAISLIEAEEHEIRSEEGGSSSIEHMSGDMQANSIIEDKPKLTVGKILSRVKRCGGGGGGDDDGDANRARRARRSRRSRRARRARKAKKAAAAASSTTTVTRKVIQNGQVVSQTVQQQPQTACAQQIAPQQPVIVQQQPAQIVQQQPAQIVQQIPNSVAQPQQVIQPQPQQAINIPLPSVTAQGSVKLSG